MEQSEPVLCERRGPVLHVTINRPERRNAINAEILAGIARALDRAEGEPDTRLVVLTGAGRKAFCAGADLGGGPAAFGQDFALTDQPFAELLRRARRCRLPLVARINGACMAGGMGLLAMCDMAVAADHAVFGLPEVKVGVFPMQVLALLRDVLALRDLAELCITGEPIDAQTANRLRLVNHVVPEAELDAKVDWLAGRVADKSPTAIRRGKYAMAAIADMTVEQALAFTESQIGPTSLTEDAAEGVAAFNEKRPPRWTGR